MVMERVTTMPGVNGTVGTERCAESVGGTRSAATRRRAVMGAGEGMRHSTRSAPDPEGRNWVMTLDRREFLALAAAGLAPAMPASLGTCATPAPRLDRIGIQLYTLRSMMGRDVEGTLAAVAAIGYREVEFAGYFERTPATLRSLIDRHRLTA